LRRTLVLQQFYSAFLLNKSEVHYPPLAGAGCTMRRNIRKGVDVV
jgi:hypothetical protein